MNNDRLSHGLWEATSSPLPDAGRLEGDINAEVVIVGGGFTGCAAALHLAESGRATVLLEGDEIGFGGSGRNVGLVNAGLWVMPDELPRRLGTRRGEQLLKQLGDAPSLVFDLVQRYSIDCEATTAGTLHCAAGQSGLEELAERARQWQQLGAPIELLDAAETRHKLGTDAYSGSLLDRRAGTIQPLAYVRGLARAATELGSRLFVRSPVSGFNRKGASWNVQTAGGSVTAPWVIIATDAYSELATARIRREQILLPYFNLATRPLNSSQLSKILPQRQGAWDTKKILSSFRLDNGGRLIFGSVGALRGTGKPIHVGWAYRELSRLFPELGDVEFEHQWYGQIGMTSDALPRFHCLDRNMISISGFNGRGIAPGTTFGRDLAQVVTGALGVDELALPATEVKIASLRPVKSTLYEIGAQAAHFLGSRR
ncbi:NAD(P)/FAD-dependent oxidoreductase [Sphingomonas sp.]|uniref:NAD(P)/FAD-dependent oxidoreductase n=1 Tax=Sphingomonas sp. TaxID=28214 RepID=UPI003BA8A830